LKQRLPINLRDGLSSRVSQLPTRKRLDRARQ
jgi:hypothetical protein